MINSKKSLDRWIDYKRENNCNNEEELQSLLRERFLNCLKNSKTTQRMISKSTDIPESALSQWKNHKPIGFERIYADNITRVCPTTLDAFSAGAILIYLENEGF